MDSNHKRQFASDNYAGICPEAWEALQEANHGHARGYGDDPFTAQAADLLRETFETDCEVYFVFNGTAANSLALASMCRSYHSILCHETAHVETDECGAPEFVSNGTKVLLLKGDHGKVDPQTIEQTVTRRSDIHFPKPKVVSVTESTELGTVYTTDELLAISDGTHRRGLKLHMDGARFANAVVSLNLPPSQITWKAGIDVLCFGGSKNGAPVGEVVVFFDRDLAYEFDYRCKQAGQLCSKMRFLSAPWVGMLRDGAWLKHAGNANRMAELLESELKEKLGITPVVPRQANAVFVDLHPAAAEAMHQKGWIFYNFIAAGGCRLMCSWDTQPDDIHDFIHDLGGVIQ